MKISWDKLEKGREGQVEAVNLKHNQVADLLSNKGIYPAFHMTNVTGLVLFLMILYRMKKYWN